MHPPEKSTSRGLPPSGRKPALPANRDFRCRISKSLVFPQRRDDLFYSVRGLRDDPRPPVQPGFFSLPHPAVRDEDSKHRSHAGLKRTPELPRELRGKRSSAVWEDRE